MIRVRLTSYDGRLVKRSEKEYFYITSDNEIVSINIEIIQRQNKEEKDLSLMNFNEVNKYHLIKILKQTEGDLNVAAKRIGVRYETLRARVKKAKKNDAEFAEILRLLERKKELKKYVT